MCKEREEKAARYAQRVNRSRKTLGSPALEEK